MPIDLSAKREYILQSFAEPESSGFADTPARRDREFVLC